MLCTELPRVERSAKRASTASCLACSPSLAHASPCLPHAALPQSAVDGLLQEAGGGGKPWAAQSRLELLRRAGCHVLECSEADVRAAVRAHMEQAERQRRRGKAAAQPGKGAAKAGGTRGRPQGTPPRGGSRPPGSPMQLAALMQVRHAASRAAFLPVLHLR